MRTADRRRTILALGAFCAVTVWPVCAQGQNKVWRMGFLAVRSRPASLESDSSYGAFVRAMRELGYVEGKNLVIDWRFADSDYKRLPVLAAELTRSDVSLIVTHTTQAAKVLQAATRTIPIVVTGMGDPVGSGLVQSLGRPGGNVTGISPVALDITSKQIEFLKDALPSLKRLALLANPGNATLNSRLLKSAQATCQSMAIELVPVYAATADEIARIMSAMRSARVDALIVANDAFFNGQQPQRLLVDLASEHRIPTMYAYSDFARAGGLMSYGESLSEVWAHLATYVDKILHGARPAELPVEQATKVELIINLKSARALGLTIPKELLLRANAVIE